MSDALKLGNSTLRMRDDVAASETPTVRDYSLSIHGVPTKRRVAASPVGEVVQLKSEEISSLPRLVGRLRFRHLALLVALDDHRNLHRAASAVHLSQPTASKTIQDLEWLFRSPLFDRTPTGMHPTEFGTLILAFARRSLGDLKRVAAASDQRRAHANPQLVIGVSVDLSSDYVAEAMAEMKRLRPELPLKIICDSNHEIFNRLIAGDLELVVGHHSDRIHPGIVHYDALGHETLCILARQGHPLNAGPSLPMYELHRAAWILQSDSSCAREVIEHMFRRAGLSPPGNIVESDSLSMILNLLLRGDVLALLPERAARLPLQEGHLVRLPIVLDRARVEFGILSRADEPLSPAALEFRASLRRSASLSRPAKELDSISD
jgi:DNA-binding transcriptional LysR family regulator